MAEPNVVFEQYNANIQFMVVDRRQLIFILVKQKQQCVEEAWP